MYIKSDDAQIWTCTSGQRLPVILCNGVSGCCDYLESVAALMDDVAQVANLMPPAKHLGVIRLNHYIWFTHAEILKAHFGAFIGKIEQLN